jgi:flagellar biosynthesis regulator FlbT
LVESNKKRFELFFYKENNSMKYLLFLLSVAIFHGASAQSAQDEVKAAVNRLFTAMKNADSASLINCFTDSAILQTIANTTEGKVAIHNEATAEFAKQISKLQKGFADERITFDVLRIDGALAIVWAPYKFYYKGKFSHCGVDSFELVKVNGQWKIQYLIDTRRTVGCE